MTLNNNLLEIKKNLLENQHLPRTAQAERLNAIGLTWNDKPFAPWSVCAVISENFPELRKKRQYTKGPNGISAKINQCKAEVMEWDLPGQIRREVYDVLSKDWSGL